MCVCKGGGVEDVAEQGVSADLIPQAQRACLHGMGWESDNPHQIP